jgi:hypothetical protein
MMIIDEEKVMVPLGKSLAGLNALSMLLPFEHK